MNNKKVKQLIESVTPPPSEEAYLPFNVFPWDADFMCPWDICDMNKSKRTMLKLNKRFSADFVAEIKDILDDCEADMVLGFTRRKDGSNESDIDDDNVGCYFIDEHENGGYGGDSYSGLGYIKVSKKDYLKFSYSM
tara:strand:+ start:39906 stop:40313 length:408 start_codon:yes stop_codon:yes gene_type:complete